MSIVPEGARPLRPEVYAMQTEGAIRRLLQSDTVIRPPADEASGENATVLLHVERGSQGDFADTTWALERKAGATTMLRLDTCLPGAMDTDGDGSGHVKSARIIIDEDGKGQGELVVSGSANRKFEVSQSALAQAMNQARALTWEEMLRLTKHIGPMYENRIPDDWKMREMRSLLDVQRAQQTGNFISRLFKKRR